MQIVVFRSLLLISGRAFLLEDFLSDYATFMDAPTRNFLMLTTLVIFQPFNTFKFLWHEWHMFPQFLTKATTSRAKLRYGFWYGQAVVSFFQVTTVIFFVIRTFISPYRLVFRCFTNGIHLRSTIR